MAAHSVAAAISQAQDARSRLREVMVVVETLVASGEGMLTARLAHNLASVKALTNGPTDAPLKAVAEQISDLGPERNATAVLGEFVNAAVALLDAVRLILRELEEVKCCLLAVGAMPPKRGRQAAGHNYEHLDLLSLQQQRAIGSMLEYIVVFGVYPCLQAGVGLRLAYRVAEPVHPLEALVAQLHGNVAQLESCAMAMARAFDHESLANVIACKHLPDVVVALVQLVWGPRATESEADHVANNQAVSLVSVAASDTPTVAVNKVLDMVVQQTRSGSGLRQTAFAALQRVLQSFASPVRVFEALFMLGGSRSGNQVAPIWFKRACSIVVACTAMHTGGVAALLATFLFQGATGMDDAMFWQRCEQAASLIAGVTGQRWFTEEAYFSAVGRQLLALLTLPTSDANKFLSRASTTVITRLLEIRPLLAETYVFCPLLFPLRRCVQYMMRAEGCTLPRQEAPTVLVAEEELDSSVGQFHRLLATVDPTARLLLYLEPGIMPLFRLHTFAAHSGSHIKQAVKDILSVYFNLLEAPTAIEQSLRLMLPLLGPEAQEEVHVCFTAGLTGGVALQWLPIPLFRQLQREAELCIELIAGIRTPGVLTGVFGAVLDQYVAIIPLLEDDVTGQHGQQYALLLHSLARMCEELGPDLLQNMDEGVKLIATMLSTGQPENIVLSLGLLEGLLSGMVDIRGRDAAAMQTLLPVLEPLTKSTNADIAGGAARMQLAIATRDPGTGGQSKETSTADQLGPILQDLQDLSVPVRAYACVQLRKLVQAKAPEVTRNITFIMGIFSAQLADPDSFLYLAAINGFVALGFAFPEETIPVVAREYGDFRRPVELRLKAGEALMKIVRDCGAVLPTYAPMFIPILFQATRDEDATVRASALSNLATACELLRYSVGLFLQELLHCVTATINHDREEQVRRGAVHVLTLLLRGFGRDALEAMPEELRDIMRALRRAASTDPDEITRYHARVALAELDEIVQGFMTARPPNFYFKQ